MKVVDHQLPAGILNTVMGISLVITGIVSALISLVYYQNLILLKSGIQKRLTVHTHSGLQYLLASEKPIYAQSYPLNFYQNTNDTVMLLQKPWGVFDIGVITARKGNAAQTLIALIGALPNQRSRATLYLADDNEPLSISGNTKIVGDCFLPKAGVKVSYMNNEGYTGTKLVDGIIHESSPLLPSQNGELIKRLAFYDDANNLSLLASGQSVAQLRQVTTHTFAAKPLLIYTPYDLILQQTNIQGNVILAAGQRVFIESTAQLDQVLVIGTSVIIKKGFKGNLQVLAKDTIIVEESCQLTYPSALVTYGPQKHSYTDIGANCTLGGVIYGSRKEEPYLNKLVIGQNATVTGQATIDGLVEHKGAIYGSLTCKKFFLMTAAALYQNHLQNAVLDGTKLPKHFATSQFLSPNSPKAVVRWLP